jgi:hypothetical protein
VDLMSLINLQDMLPALQELLVHSSKHYGPGGLSY